MQTGFNDSVALKRDGLAALRVMPAAAHDPARRFVPRAFALAFMSGATRSAAQATPVAGTVSCSTPDATSSAQLGSARVRAIGAARRRRGRHDDLGIEMGIFLPIPLSEVSVKAKEEKYRGKEGQNLHRRSPVGSQREAAEDAAQR
jgi:hypothetical protein